MSDRIPWRVWKAMPGGGEPAHVPLADRDRWAHEMAVEVQPGETKFQMSGDSIVVVSRSRDGHTYTFVDADITRAGRHVSSVPPPPSSKPMIAGEA